MQPESPASKTVVLARVGKAHGIKGWVKLNSFTSPPENIFEYREFIVRKGQGNAAVEMDECREQAGKLLAHFRGYDDPESVRELTGLDLMVESQSLPALEEGNYYWHELQGLTVRNLQDEVFGTVRQLLETGANDVLVVSPTTASIDERERLIPYIAGQVIKGVDLETATLTVDWEADYLS